MISQLSLFSWTCYDFSFFLGYINACVYMQFMVSIHSAVDGHLGWLQFLAVVDSAAINKACKHLCDVWVLWASTQERCSWTTCCFYLQVFKELPYWLSPSLAVRQGSSFPTASPSLLPTVFMLLVILTAVRWVLKALLICMSLMTKDAEYFSSVYWPFGFLLLRTIYFVHQPIYWSDHLFLSV